MEELLSHIDVVVIAVGVIAGYVDVRKTVKDSVKRLDKFEDTVLKIFQRLEQNDKADAVRERKIEELSEYKSISSQSKDLAMEKLSKIETLVEQLIKRDDERHAEYSRRFEILEERVRSN